MWRTDRINNHGCDQCAHRGVPIGGYLNDAELNTEAQKILRTQIEKHPDAAWVFPSGAGES